MIRQTCIERSVFKSEYGACVRNIPPGRQLGSPNLRYIFERIGDKCHEPFTLIPTFQHSPNLLEKDTHHSHHSGHCGKSNSPSCKRPPSHKSSSDSDFNDTSSCHKSHKIRRAPSKDHSAEGEGQLLKETQCNPHLTIKTRESHQKSNQNIAIDNCREACDRYVNSLLSPKELNVVPPVKSQKLDCINRSNADFILRRIETQLQQMQRILHSNTTNSQSMQTSNYNYSTPPLPPLPFSAMNRCEANNDTYPLMSDNTQICAMAPPKCIGFDANDDRSKCNRNMRKKSPGDCDKRCENVQLSSSDSNVSCCLKKSCCRVGCCFKSKCCRKRSSRRKFRYKGNSGTSTARIVRCVHNGDYDKYLDTNTLTCTMPSPEDFNATNLNNKDCCYKGSKSSCCRHSGCCKRSCCRKKSERSICHNRENSLSGYTCENTQEQRYPCGRKRKTPCCFRNRSERSQMHSARNSRTLIPCNSMANTKFCTMMPPPLNTVTVCTNAWPGVNSCENIEEACRRKGKSSCGRVGCCRKRSKYQCPRNVINTSRPPMVQQCNGNSDYVNNLISDCLTTNTKFCKIPNAVSVSTITCPVMNSWANAPIEIYPCGRRCKGSLRRKSSCCRVGCFKSRCSLRRSERGQVCGAPKKSRTSVQCSGRSGDHDLSLSECTEMQRCTNEALQICLTPENVNHQQQTSGCFQMNNIRLCTDVPRVIKCTEEIIQTCSIPKLQTQRCQNIQASCMPKLVNQQTSGCFQAKPSLRSKTSCCLCDTSNITCKCTKTSANPKVANQHISDCFPAKTHIRSKPSCCLCKSTNTKEVVIPICTANKEVHSYPLSVDRQTSNCSPIQSTDQHLQVEYCQADKLVHCVPEKVDKETFSCLPVKPSLRSNTTSCLFESPNISICTKSCSKSRLQIECCHSIQTCSPSIIHQQTSTICECPKEMISTCTSEIAATDEQVQTQVCCQVDKEVCFIPTTVTQKLSCCFVRNTTTDQCLQTQRCEADKETVCTPKTVTQHISGCFPVCSKYSTNDQQLQTQRSEADKEVDCSPYTVNRQTSNWIPAASLALCDPANCCKCTKVPLRCQSAQVSSMNPESAVCFRTSPRCLCDTSKSCKCTQQQAPTCVKSTSCPSKGVANQQVAADIQQPIITPEYINTLICLCNKKYKEGYMKRQCSCPTTEKKESSSTETAKNGKTKVSDKNDTDVLSDKSEKLLRCTCLTEDISLGSEKDVTGSKTPKLHFSREWTQSYASDNQPSETNESSHGRVDVIYDDATSTSSLCGRKATQDMDLDTNITCDTVKKCPPILVKEVDCTKIKDTHPQKACVHACTSPCVTRTTLERAAEIFTQMFKPYEHFSCTPECHDGAGRCSVETCTQKYETRDNFTSCTNAVCRDGQRQSSVETSTQKYETCENVSTCTSTLCLEDIISSKQNNSTVETFTEECGLCEDFATSTSLICHEEVLPYKEDKEIFAQVSLPGTLKDDRNLKITCCEIVDAVTLTDLVFQEDKSNSLQDFTCDCSTSDLSVQANVVGTNEASSDVQGTSFHRPASICRNGVKVGSSIPQPTFVATEMVMDAPSTCSCKSFATSTNAVLQKEQIIAVQDSLIYKPKKTDTVTCMDSSFNVKDGLKSSGDDNIKVLYMPKVVTQNADTNTLNTAQVNASVSPQTSLMLKRKSNLPIATNTSNTQRLPKKVVCKTKLGEENKGPKSAAVNKIKIPCTPKRFETSKSIKKCAPATCDETFAEVNKYIDSALFYLRHQPSGQVAVEPIPCCKHLDPNTVMGLSLVQTRPQTNGTEARAAQMCTNDCRSRSVLGYKSDITHRRSFKSNLPAIDEKKNTERLSPPKCICPSNSKKSAAKLNNNSCSCSKKSK